MTFSVSALSPEGTFQMFAHLSHLWPLGHFSKTLVVSDWICIIIEQNKYINLCKNPKKHPQICQKLSEFQPETSIGNLRNCSIPFCYSIRILHWYILAQIQDASLFIVVEQAWRQQVYLLNVNHLLINDKVILLMFLQ